MAQSNRCSGLETTRDDTTSPTVSGPRLPITEAGLRVAWYRCRTATSASSSLVTPELMHVPLRPHRVPRRHVGAVHVAAPVIDPRRRARGRPPARAYLPVFQPALRRLLLRKGHGRTPPGWPVHLLGFGPRLATSPAHHYYSIFLSITIYLTERQCTQEGPA